MIEKVRMQSTEPDLRKRFEGGSRDARRIRSVNPFPVAEPPCSSRSATRRSWPTRARSAPSPPATPKTTATTPRSWPASPPTTPACCCLSRIAAPSARGPEPDPRPRHPGQGADHDRQRPNRDTGKQGTILLQGTPSRVRVTALSGLALRGRALDSSPTSFHRDPNRHRAHTGPQRVRIEIRDESQTLKIPIALRP